MVIDKIIRQIETRYIMILFCKSIFVNFLKIIVNITFTQIFRILCLPIIFLYVIHSLSFLFLRRKSLWRSLIRQSKKRTSALRACPGHAVDRGWHPDWVRQEPFISGKQAAAGRPQVSGHQVVALERMQCDLWTRPQTEDEIHNGNLYTKTI